jgi:hypothetical protein
MPANLDKKSIKTKMRKMLWRMMMPSANYRLRGMTTILPQFWPSP